MTPDNTKPDYSFITNQPGPDLGKPPRSKKPLLIIGGLVAFLFIVTIIGLGTFRRSTNVQQVNVGSAEGAAFFNDVANNNLDLSYERFQSQDALDKTWFDQNFIQPYNERFDMASCTQQVDQYTTTDTEAKLIYHCPYKDKSQGDYVVLAVTVNRHSNKITSVKMVTTNS